MKLVFFLYSWSTFALAVRLPFHPRIEPCQAETAEDMAESGEGPTSDGSAGLGAEFENPSVAIVPVDKIETPFSARANLKGKLIVDHQGDKFKLTVDGQGMGNLQPEYILDGTSIKVGSGDAAKAAAAAAQDFLDWKPWGTSDVDPSVKIVDSDDNYKWKLENAPRNEEKAKDSRWEVQITAPMPLEGVYHIIKNHKTRNDPDFDHRSVLDSNQDLGENPLIPTSKDWFQSNSNGINKDGVTDDVLGFCSLVLSYAKAAGPLLGNANIKQGQPIMPRTDFSTVYKQVKTKIPGDLWQLFDSLACYTNDQQGSTIIDVRFCSGSLDHPVSNGKFGQLTYSKTNTPFSVNNKKWIESIAAGSPDDMSRADSSIGFLRERTERMFDSQRSVPIFEFRATGDIKTTEFESHMQKVDQTIQDLHKQFATVPQKRRRDDDALICPSVAPNSTLESTGTSSRTTSAPQASITCEYMDKTPQQSAGCSCVSGSSTITVPPISLASVSVITQSCQYSTWPGSQPSVTAPPASVVTDFIACEVCTVIGPNEDDCSPLPSSMKCIPATTSRVISAATSGVTVGTLTGSAFYSAVTSAIDQVCQVPSNTGGGVGTFTCTETATATVASNIKYVDSLLGEQAWDNKGSLTLQITEANYDSLEWYQTSKAALALVAQNSTQGNCKDIQADLFPGSKLRRENPAAADDKPPRASENICQAGSHFQLIETDRVANVTRELSFGLKFQVESGDSIICDFLVGVLDFLEVSFNEATGTEPLIAGEFQLDEKLLEECKKHT